MYKTVTTHTTNRLELARQPGYGSDSTETIRPVFSPSQDVPNQFVYNLPVELGRGRVTVDAFSSGLCLMHMDLKSTRPITFVDEHDNYVFGIGFRLDGYSECRIPTQRQSFSIDKGKSGQFSSPGSIIAEEDIGITHKVETRILFDEKTLLDLADEDEEPFLSFLKPFKEQAPDVVLDKILPEMKRVLYQIITCPYNGRTRSLFLEGKTMELLAHKLEQAGAKEESLPKQPCINKTDVERIHHAAEILVCDPVNPPDLTDLAAKTGMSRSKFYQKFKLVFGHSPMDHLRSHRLQAARQLLQKGGYNVAEAAFAVGFNNPSYFAKVFAAEFGISPHQVI